MSRHLGLREEARAAHWLARRIARLFPVREAGPASPGPVQAGGALARIDGRCCAWAYQCARRG